MYALDFEYEELRLSDFGFIICSFDSSNGVETVNSGSTITFNKVAANSGKKYFSIGTKYDNCIQATFDICKNPDENNDMYITNDEYRKLVRWLNRREFLKLRFIDDEHENEPCYYYASFNTEEIKIRGLLYGIRLSMETNSPFGFGNEIVHNFSVENTNTHLEVIDMSDEIGISYPKIEITCRSTGDITITSTFDDTILSSTTIKNCKIDEVISIDGENQIITSSESDTHNIANDFNYEFLKIKNSYNKKLNIITSSAKCLLTVKYNPIIKDVL